VVYQKYLKLVDFQIFEIARNTWGAKTSAKGSCLFVYMSKKLWAALDYRVTR